MAHKEYAHLSVVKQLDIHLPFLKKINEKQTDKMLLYNGEIAGNYGV
jgi:hypothetical protein